MAVSGSSSPCRKVLKESSGSSIAVILCDVVFQWRAERAARFEKQDGVA